MKQQVEQLLINGLVMGVFTATTPVLLQALQDIQTTKTLTTTCILLNLPVPLSAPCAYSQHTEIAQLDETLKGFHNEEGPFVSSVEQALAFCLHHQAYYLEMFMGKTMFTEHCR